MLFCFGFALLECDPFGSQFKPEVYSLAVPLWLALNSSLQRAAEVSDQLLAFQLLLSARFLKSLLHSFGLVNFSRASYVWIFGLTFL